MLVTAFLSGATPPKKILYPPSSSREITNEPFTGSNYENADKTITTDVATNSGAETNNLDIEKNHEST